MSKGTTTLKEAVEKYMEYLAECGKTERTQYTYKKDLDLALEFFGETKEIARLIPAHIAKFFKSDFVNKVPKSGREKSPLTIEKTRRVFRQMLVFCKEQNFIEKISLPKDEMAKIKETADPEQPTEAAAEGK